MFIRYQKVRNTILGTVAAIGGTVGAIFGYQSIQKSDDAIIACLLYTSPSPRDKRQSRMPSSA